MPITPQDFVSKWKRADARERQAVKELVNQEKRLLVDPASEVDKKHFDKPLQCPSHLAGFSSQAIRRSCAAYGWQSDLSDEEILEKLLALNLERGK